MARLKPTPEPEVRAVRMTMRLSSRENGWKKLWEMIESSMSSRGASRSNSGERMLYFSIIRWSSPSARPGSRSGLF